MKPNRKNLLLGGSAAITVAFSAQSANAQNLYWDGNNGTTGFGSASGTWAAPTTGTATAGWSTSSTGVVVVAGNSVTTTTANTTNFGTDAVGFGLGGGTITVSGTVNTSQLRFGNQTTSSVTLSGGTINFAAAGIIHVGAGGATNHNITSSITGAGTSLTKTGNTLTLSGANSYTGTTIISTGTLILNNLSALGSTSGVTIGGAAGATLSSNLDGIIVTAPITTANSGITSTIAFGRNASAAGSITLNGAIGGNGNVTFTSPNANSGGNLQTINLGATGTYLGTTTLNTGNTGVALTLRNSSGAANVLPTTTVLTFGTGAGSGTGRATTFELNGQNQTLAGLSNAGSVPVDRNQRVSSATAATLTINNATDFTFGGSTLEIGGNTTTTNAQITGAISLVKNGAGTFTLGGTLLNGASAAGNSFTGSTTVLGGILVLGQSDSIRNSAFDTNASIGGNSTNGLRTTPSFLRIGGLTGGNDFATRFTTASGGYNTLTGITLNPNTGDTLTYSGDVGDGVGGMNLTKSGSGTQILTGTNTHTGITTVSAGVLAVNGSLANTSTVTVSGTGTLKGSGSINSSVTIDSGGTLASGTSIESLATGALSFTTGSTFQYELDSDVAEQGDLTAVTGNLSLAGTVNLSFLETGTGSWELGSPLGDHFGSPAADKLTLISYTGTWNGGLFTYLGNELQDDSYFILNGQQWFLNYNDTDAGTNFTGDLVGSSFVTMTVPEPGAALLGGLGLLALLRRRR